jgi:hypothetical protein
MSHVHCYFQSPSSCKVTLQQLQEGAKINLAECLQMEYRLTQRFMVCNNPLMINTDSGRRRREDGLLSGISIKDTNHKSIRG